MNKLELVSEKTLGSTLEHYEAYTVKVYHEPETVKKYKQGAYIVVARCYDEPLRENIHGTPDASINCRVTVYEGKVVVADLRLQGICYDTNWPKLIFSLNVVSLIVEDTLATISLTWKVESGDNAHFYECMYSGKGSQKVVVQKKPELQDIRAFRIDCFKKGSTDIFIPDEGGYSRRRAIVPGSAYDIRYPPEDYPHVRRYLDTLSERDAFLWLTATKNTR